MSRSTVIAWVNWKHIKLFPNHEHFRREQEDQVELGKELMRQEFTEWLTQVILAKMVTETNFVSMMQVEIVLVDRSGMPDLHFGMVREFHRCKAIQDVEQSAFDEIVDNMASIMEIEESRKNEIKLAKHSQFMVNVIEDFEHGERGFYTYGKYQTMRRPNGNMDLVFAIHAFKWQLEREEEEGSDLSKSNRFEQSMWAAGKRGGLVSMREKELLKSQFRSVIFPCQGPI